MSRRCCCIEESPWPCARCLDGKVPNCLNITLNGIAIGGVPGLRGIDCGCFNPTSFNLVSNGQCTWSGYFHGGGCGNYGRTYASAYIARNPATTEVALHVWVIWHRETIEYKHTMGYGDNVDCITTLRGPLALSFVSHTGSGICDHSGMTAVVRTRGGARCYTQGYYRPGYPGHTWTGPFVGSKFCSSCGAGFPGSINLQISGASYPWYESLHGLYVLAFTPWMSCCYNYVFPVHICRVHAFTLCWAVVYDPLGGPGGIILRLNVSYYPYVSGAFNIANWALGDAPYDCSSGFSGSVQTSLYPFDVDGHTLWIGVGW